MNGYQEFLADPEEWWRRQLQRDEDPARAEFREAIERAQPNPGHHALVEMERMGHLAALITQNIDNLHFIAGSQRVLEIHGNRTKVRCVSCELRWHREEFTFSEPSPSCPECGGLIKSDTVMFGEPIPAGVLARCFDETGSCDCMIVIGTSATVYPAAGFPADVTARGGSVVELNPRPTPLSPMSEVIVRGPTGETLPMLVERLKAIGDPATPPDAAGV
jgi:NAD-dependent deacetylase